jgi:hypothetical protein
MALTLRSLEEPKNRWKMLKAGVRFVRGVGGGREFSPSPAGKISPFQGARDLSSAHASVNAGGRRITLK